MTPRYTGLRDYGVPRWQAGDNGGFGAYVRFICRQKTLTAPLVHQRRSPPLPPLHNYVLQHFPVATKTPWARQGIKKQRPEPYVSHISYTYCER